MKTFQVLDRHLNLHQHYLLEASAGTGKTFSIQNIVIRLLIESSQEEPLLLNRILVVTFTRAATRELRQRIRSTIEQMLEMLDQWLENGIISPTTPDYLLACLELGIEHVQTVKKRLQRALFVFDQAQIFTIHSFCFRMLNQYALEGDMGFQPQTATGEEPLPTAEIMRVIRDFFRTEIRSELYSPGQLSILLKEDPDQKKLLKAIMSGYEFAEMPSCRDLYAQFIEEMRILKQKLELNSADIIEDFKTQSGSYCNHKSGETKAETLAKISRFAALFDQETWDLADFDSLLSDGLVWVQALTPKLLKGRAPASHTLHYPELTKLLQNHLVPLIQKASDFSILLARFSRDCRQLLKRYQQEEERLSPDDLLKKMQWALHHPDFITHIQSSYQVVIVDEFQDTDPIQWDIFRRLFLSEERPWKGYLYLVGDPKQSIYSFRQADIYTYLAAAQTLGEECYFSLDTNYRSQPHLVQALNTLFSAEHVPNLISLPKKKDQHLPYQAVQASQLILTKDFQDDRGAVHFFISDGIACKRSKLTTLEEQIFFPFIAQEIESLRQQGIAFNQFAVLVRDRHQAFRLTEFFDRKKIPSVSQHGVSLAESVALYALIDVIRAILHPHDLGAIKTALGSPLMGWTHKDLKLSSEMDRVLIQIQTLRHTLLGNGFSSFFCEFMQSKWQVDGLTVLERLLTQEGGIELYHDLQQIVGLIIDHHYREWSSPEGLIPFLDLFQIWHANEDKRIKRFQDPSKDGIKILTLHSSKGLEFDVVFALGLINRLGLREELIPVEKEGQLILVPLAEESEEYRHYCEESDAEKMRQLYVAMTRAKYRLYVPLAFHLPSEGLRQGEASPIDLFLARLGQPVFSSYQDLYDRIKHYDGKIFQNFIDTIGKDHYLTYSMHQEVYFEGRKEEFSSKELIPPHVVSIPGQSLIMTSFSSLTHHLSPSHREDSSALMLPHDFKRQEKNIHTLPASRDIGLLLHQILEKIPFQEFKKWDNPDQAISLIRPFIQKSYFKDWQDVIVSLIFTILKVPLSVGEQSICLSDLPSYQMYREMPFLFSYEGTLAIEEVNFSEGFITGVIDLIFLYQDRYYILDWKSNWLGPNLEAYSFSCLHDVMVSNHYFLQALLYKEALRRYTKLVDQRSFEECFGGVIYVFMRGRDVEEQTGVYYFFP